MDAERQDPEGSGNLLALILLCSAGALSIGYRPDFIHVAFIAALFSVFWAETIEVGVRSIGRAQRVDANIIRIAVYEMTTPPGLPIEIAINEAIEVVRKFGPRSRRRSSTGCWIRWPIGSG